MSFIIGSLCSVVATAITGVVASLGSGVLGFANTVSRLLAVAINNLPIAQQILSFANDFLKALGILKPEESIEELGERALQAMEEGYSMDEFEHFSDYLQFLRDYKLEATKDAEHSLAEKITSGLAISTVAIEKKYDIKSGDFNGIWLLPLVNKAYFTPERMVELVSTGKITGDVLAYLNNKMELGARNQFEKQLETDEMNKELSAEGKKELYQALDTACEEWGRFCATLEQITQQGE